MVLWYNKYTVSFSSAFATTEDFVIHNAREHLNFELKKEDLEELGVKSEPCGDPLYQAFKYNPKGMEGSVLIHCIKVNVISLTLYSYVTVHYQTNENNDITEVKLTASAIKPDNVGEDPLKPDNVGEDPLKVNGPAASMIISNNQPKETSDGISEKIDMVDDQMILVEQVDSESGNWNIGSIQDKEPIIDQDIEIEDVKPLVEPVQSSVGKTEIQMRSGDLSTGQPDTAIADNTEGIEGDPKDEDWKPSNPVEENCDKKVYSTPRLKKLTKAKKSTSGKQYHCPVCNVTYSRKGCLGQHLKWAHGLRQCHAVCKKLLRVLDFDSHPCVTGLVPEESKPFEPELSKGQLQDKKCHICGKQFTCNSRRSKFDKNI